SNLSLPELSLSGRRELLHVLRSQDLQLIGLRTEIGPRGFAPDSDIDRAISSLDRTMETAAGLQAPLVCLDIGPLPVPPQPPRSAQTITAEQAGSIIIPDLATQPRAKVLAPHAPSPRD